jgi:hypothetical protein
MPARTLLHRIQQLDPERDHLEIVRLSSCYEFPFDMTRALEFALFRTYAVPSISALLDRTGEFHRAAQKRYDDTAIIVSLLMEEGYDSERGRAALRNMNRQHGRFPISNDDYLYVLSTFVFEPPRWLERFGWRPMCEAEKLALFHLWREIARRMNIRDVPADYAAFERFNREYEHTHFRYADSNRRVGEATVNLFLSWFLPRPLYPLGAPFIYALLDEPLLAAFGFPRPPGWLRRLVAGALKLRARLVRLMGDRRTPLWHARKKYRSYPNGYRIEELGLQPAELNAMRSSRP